MDSCEFMKTTIFRPTPIMCTPNTGEEQTCEGEEKPTNSFAMEPKIQRKHWFINLALVGRFEFSLGGFLKMELGALGGARGPYFIQRLSVSYTAVRTD